MGRSLPPPPLLLMAWPLVEELFCCIPYLHPGLLSSLYSVDTVLEHQHTLYKCKDADPDTVCPNYIILFLIFYKRWTRHLGHTVRSSRKKKLNLNPNLTFSFTFFIITVTECPKIYRTSVLHPLKYRFVVYLSRCSTELRYILGHSVLFQTFSVCLSTFLSVI